MVVGEPFIGSARSLASDAFDFICVRVRECSENCVGIDEEHLHTNIQLLWRFHFQKKHFERFERLASQGSQFLAFRDCNTKVIKVLGHNVWVLWERGAGTEGTDDCRNGRDVLFLSRQMFASNQLKQLTNINNTRILGSVNNTFPSYLPTSPRCPR